MDIDEQATDLEAGWAVIMGAPYHFAAVCLIAIGIIYTVFHVLHGAAFKSKDSTIEALRERLAWTEEQRDSYKSQLSEYESEYKEVKDKTPRRLQQKALALVAEIRTFLDRERREGDVLSFPEYHEMHSATNEDEQVRLWNQLGDALSRHYTETVSEFDNRFKVAAIVMRDELLTHLPEYSPEGEVNYDRPINPLGMGAIADDMERMARLLEVA